VNIAFYAAASRRVKLGKVADFQACTVGISLCTDAEETSEALGTAKRLRMRRSSIGLQVAQVLFRVHGRRAARAGCRYSLLVNAIGDVAGDEYARMLTLHQFLRD